MAKRPPLFEIEQARIDELLKFIRTLDDATQQVVIKSLSQSLTDPVLKAKFAEVQALVKATDGQVRQWLTANVPQSYFDGYQLTNQKTDRKTTITYQAFLNGKDTIFHRNAINLLLKEGYGDFARMMVGVSNGAERMLNEVARQQIRGQIAAGEFSGSSIPTIAKDVRSTLQEQGFKVLIDRAGRKWQLTDYSEMLARTNLIKTANEGVMNRMTELGYDVVEWSAADEGACVICDSLDGKTFSLSGNNADYPPLDTQPPAHPNCRCSLLPRPELQ